MDYAVILQKRGELAARFRIARAERTGLLSIGLTIACLWGLDVAMTALAIQSGAVEIGFVAGILLSGGLATLAVGKAIGLLVLMSIAWLMTAQGKQKTAYWGLAIVGSLSLAIVIWNLLVILSIASGYLIP